MGLAQRAGPCIHLLSKHRADGNSSLRGGGRRRSEASTVSQRSNHQGTEAGPIEGSSFVRGSFPGSAPLVPWGFETNPGGNIPWNRRLIFSRRLVSATP